MFGRTQKNKKKNNISANIVNGNIIQDSSVENNYITINDPAIAIRNIGKNSEELTKYFARSLWLKPGPVPGKQAGPADVVQAAQLHGQPLQADTQAAVGRRAVLVEQQVARKILRLHAPRL